MKDQKVYLTLILIIVSWIIGDSLDFLVGKEMKDHCPRCGSDQRITHKIRFNPWPHYVIKTSRSKYDIKNEEFIIMSYLWHSQRQGDSDATRFTWIYNQTQKLK